MKQYLDALKFILDNGETKQDRTGVGTISTFGLQMRFNLQVGFPAITTKKLAWKAVVSELLWFLEGSSDERRLAEILHGSRDQNLRTIWTDNANSEYWKPKAKYDGDLGNVYGYQWRNFNGVDQVTNLIKGIKTDPNGRRHIINAWNVSELDQMALPPCHVMSQFYVSNNKLSCQMYQRSADFFLGVPFNIASYSLLTHIIAKECNLKVGEFIWTGGDCHIYLDHVDAVKEQLSRQERPLPTLLITEGKKWDEYNVEDFILDNYDPYPPIKARMAV